MQTLELRQGRTVIPVKQTRQTHEYPSLQPGEYLGHSSEEGAQTEQGLAELKNQNWDSREAQAPRVHRTERQRAESCPDNTLRISRENFLSVQLSTEDLVPKVGDRNTLKEHREQPLELTWGQAQVMSHQPEQKSSKTKILL